MSQLIRIATFIVTLVVGVAISGCSGLSQEPPESKGPPLDTLVLLSPALGPTPQVLKQKVTLSAWGKALQYIALSRLTLEQTRVVALFPTGQQFLFVEYDGKRLVQDINEAVALDAESILAVMQFSLWPAQNLAAGYKSEHGWEIQMTEGLRQLSRYGKPLLDVRFNHPEIEIDNHLSGYKVVIHTIEKKDVAL